MIGGDAGAPYATIAAMRDGGSASEGAAIAERSLDDLIASRAYVVDPYPILARLRAEDPVHWVPAWGCWLVTRAEDIEATIRDTRRFSSADRVTQVIERMPDW